VLGRCFFVSTLHRPEALAASVSAFIALNPTAVHTLRSSHTPLITHTAAHPRVRVRVRVKAELAAIRKLPHTMLTLLS